MKDSRRIFTAEFVRAQDPEYVAELLDRCYYGLADAENDLAEAERRREREVAFAMALVGKIPRGLPPSLRCACGKPKVGSAKNCRRCFERNKRRA